MMQESRVQRERIYKRRSRRRKQLFIRRCIGIGLVLVLIVGVVMLCAVACSSNNTSKDTTEGAVTSTPLSTETTTPTQEPTTAPEETEEPIWGYGDPNNRVYPYSIMSADWGAEVYEEGYRYYQIPRSYAMEGGMFPEVAQVYLWCICKDAGVDYYMVLALIERESGYKWDATGDSGNSKGLMQIQERWHTERMEALGVEDLYNPYSNMRVGVNYIKEIQDRYLASSGAHCVLMVYNMGASGANNLWAEGIYSTAYTKQILQRAQEIKQEIQDQ